MNFVKILLVSMLFVSPAFAAGAGQVIRADSPLALNLSTGHLSIPVATSSANGYLSSTDWGTFNSKLTSPLTTKGDLLGFSTVNARIPVGTNGQLLSADSTQTLGVKWITPASITTGNLTDLGTDGITVTGGTDAVIGAGTSFSQHVSDSTHNGYLSSADWSTFSAKQSALTFGNLTDAGTDGLVVTGGTGAIIGSGASLAQHVSDSTHNGYLSSTDWATFNAKIGSLNGLTATTQTFTTGTSGTDFAISSATSTHTFNLPTASASNRGALSSADWSTFNGKQSALTIGNFTDAGTDGIVVTGGTSSVIGSGTSIAQHVADASHNGYLSSSDFNTFNAKAPAFANGNLTDAGTDGIVVTGGTGAVIGSGTSLAQHVATSSFNGYLSSTDWSTFNNKQSTVSFGTFGSTPNSAGGGISSGVITLQPADATNPGGVSTTTQTFAGNKTFSGIISGAAGTVGTPELNLSDTATGWYRPSANVWAFASNGAKQVQFGTSGINFYDSGNVANLLNIDPSATNGIGFNLPARTQFHFTSSASSDGSILSIENSSSGIAWDWYAFGTNSGTEYAGASGFRNDGSGTGNFPILMGPKDTVQIGQSLISRANTLTIQNWPDQANIGGTTTANASTTITGSAAARFLTRLGIGDRVSLSSASGTYATVVAIASDTSFTTDVAIGNGTTQTINRKRAMQRWDDPTPTNVAMLNDQGRLLIGNVASIGGPVAKLQIDNAAEAVDLLKISDNGSQVFKIADGGAVTVNSLTASMPVFTDSSKVLTSTGVVPVGSGGTGTSTTFTAGSVVFAGASGIYSQNNSKFFWDDANAALGIGIAPAATAVLDIVNNSGSTKAVQLTGYGSNVGFRGRYANGTTGSPTAATNGNIMEFLSGRGYGATGFAAASTGAINIVAGATFTDTSMPTYINLLYTPTASVTAVEGMRLNSTGNVLIGTTTDDASHILQANGTILGTGATLSGQTANTLAQFDASKNIVSVASQVFQTASLTTTDGTNTTLDTIALSDNTVYLCESLVAARRTDSSGRNAVNFVFSVYREAAGSCTANGTGTSNFSAGSDTNFQVSVNCSSNNALLQVIGNTGKTLNWTSSTRCKTAS